VFEKEVVAGEHEADETTGLLTGWTDPIGAQPLWSRPSMCPLVIVATLGPSRPTITRASTTSVDVT